jgi:hypothetical protein
MENAANAYHITEAPARFPDASSQKKESEHTTALSRIYTSIMHKIDTYEPDLNTKEVLS